MVGSDTGEGPRRGKLTLRLFYPFLGAAGRSCPKSPTISAGHHEGAELSAGLGPAHAHVFHLGGGRAAAAPVDELLDLFLGPFDDGFHFAARHVADFAGEPQPARLVLGAGPIEDALPPAADEQLRAGHLSSSP